MISKNSKIGEEMASSSNPSSSQMTKPEAEPSGAYRGFRIDYAPPPIPTRECDWQWVHDDYDGPEDNRCGHAPSLAAAKSDIDFWHEENT